MKFRNPILSGDYSDPDMIRVGSFFYMISSSFTYLPGIPVLRSGDLVHWELIGYAAARLPFERYNAPAHKCGTWAPSIRYRNGLFHVYVCLPDEGLLAFTAEDPAGEWTFHYVHDVCGWIDPCPLFEEDGTAWLVHGLAASRCGLNNMLFAHRLSPDGLRILDKGTLIYNGADHGDITVEGPKWYKRDGSYLILCPAGGVKTGYQLALRARDPLGPYERRVVLRQGSTSVNGPHQGGWTEDGRGGDWFIHFQDLGPYGRVPHLQPVRWEEDWPVMGQGGEPVSEGDTLLPEYPVSPSLFDDFQQDIGPVWQWQANPDPAWYTLLHPGLRLHACPADSLFRSGQFLSRLMPAFCFDMEVFLEPRLLPGDLAGIGMMGYPYHFLALGDGCLRLVRGEVREKGWRTPEEVQEVLLAEQPLSASPLRLRLSVREERMTFHFSGEEGPWQQIGPACPLAPGGWTGARPGLFCRNTRGKRGGSVDVRRIRFRLPEAGSACT